MNGVDVTFSICANLAGYRFIFTDERELQDGVAEVLRLSRVGFIKEHSFGPGDRVDFFLPAPGIALEVKIKGQNRSVVRQLERYAASEKVNAVVLVTTSMRHRVPDLLCGKPAYRVMVTQ